MKDEISHFGMDSLYSTGETDCYFQGDRFLGIVVPS